MPELSALSQWVQKETRKVEQESPNPRVSGWWLVLFVAAVMAPTFFRQDPVAAVPEAGLIIVVGYFVWRLFRKTPSKAGTEIEMAVEQEFPALVWNLNDSVNKEQLGEFLGTKKDLLCEAGWDRARIEDVDLSQFDSDPDGVAKLREKILRDADEALKLALVLSLLPPARFRSRKADLDETVKHCCDFLSSLADRLEAATARTIEAKAVLNPDSLRDLVAMESAREELDRLLGHPTGPDEVIRTRE